MPSGSTMEFPTFDGSLPGWLACPDEEGPRPGLILVPDVHGLSDHYRDVAMRFASVGLTTLAVDLYGREGPPTLPDLAAVTAWIRALPDDRVLRDLVAAREWLRQRDDVRSDAVAITGYCMGGQYAVLSSCRDDGWAACVAWYGMLRYVHYDERNPASPLDVADRLGCPLLGLYGAEDALIPTEDVRAFEAGASGAGHPVEFELYPGAGHAFFNDRRPDAYRPDAAADAWRCALEFFARHAAGPARR